jgi:hypothetical protein
MWLECLTTMLLFPLLLEKPAQLAQLCLGRGQPFMDI